MKCEIGNTLGKELLLNFNLRREVDGREGGAFVTAG